MTAEHEATESFDLDRAYSVETPEDSKRLYADWAATYDDEFVASHGYVYHQSVVDVFLRRPHRPGSVLDVGCGTGIVGVELRRRGVQVVDGIDISPEMLTVAATKRTADDDPVYRNLMVADLTGTVDLPDTTFAGVVSAGTFTHGHLGPDPIGELIRIARPGAIFALGVNAEHYDDAGFGEWFARAEQTGRISNFEIVTTPIYDPDRYEADDADEHADTNSSVALFHRI